MEKSRPGFDPESVSEFTMWPLLSLASTFGNTETIFAGLAKAYPGA